MTDDILSVVGAMTPKSFKQYQRTLVSRAPKEGESNRSPGSTGENVRLGEVLITALFVSFLCFGYIATMGNILKIATRLKTIKISISMHHKQKEGTAAGVFTMGSGHKHECESLDPERTRSFPHQTGE